MTEGPDQPRHRVLVVDDDPAMRTFLERLLRSADYEVVFGRDGSEAAGVLRQQSFDVIVSDIAMPGMSGIELLRTVRQYDLDVPVVLLTGNPTAQTAIDAVHYGAFRYLVKPVAAKELREVVGYAARLHDLAKVKREALHVLGSQGQLAADRAGLEASLEQALASLWMAYQPIVDCASGGVYAYEALARTARGPLTTPPAVLTAAERLNRVQDFGRTVRERVAAALAQAPGTMQLFLNLHPRELEDDALYSTDDPLAPYAERIVLEVTERERLEQLSDLQERIAALRARGFRFALDDLGAGYAGLNSFLQLEPEVVKIDRSLIQGLHGSDAKQRLVRSVTTLCRGLEIRVVAEGVELAEEHRALRALGVELLQGFAFARPSAEFVTVQVADPP